ncbi:hypothetical protein [Micropruina sp.]|uniref:hypothetical protein n=1 Tax=Micropruina sp. TaxID=2737536 RepID=UPI0039E60DCF
MVTRWSWLAAMCALAVAVTGCGPTTPTAGPGASTSASPTPSPSPTCTPYNATPHPCSAEDYGKTQQQNELIAQAEATYRTYWDENVRLQRAGGTRKATEVLLNTLEGSALKSVVENLQDLKTNKTRAVGGTFDILTITPKPTRTKEGSVTSLTVCWRAKDVAFSVDGVNIHRSVTVREESYFRYSEGVLRISIFESQKVAKC